MINPRQTTITGKIISEFEEAIKRDGENGILGIDEIHDIHQRSIERHVRFRKYIAASFFITMIQYSNMFGYEVDIKIFGFGSELPIFVELLTLINSFILMNYIFLILRSSVISKIIEEYRKIFYSDLSKLTFYLYIYRNVTHEMAYYYEKYLFSIDKCGEKISKLSRSFFSWFTIISFLIVLIAHIFASLSIILSNFDDRLFLCFIGLISLLLPYIAISIVYFSIKHPIHISLK